MKQIASRQNPLVRTFRELAERPDPDGIRLLLDGAHLVREALTAEIDIELACVAASRLERATEEGELAALLEQRGVDVVTAADRLFAALSPVRTPSGIIAIGKRHPNAIVDTCSDEPALAVVAVDVQDPGNVGALVRVAEGVGATGVLTTPGSANPFAWKAVRGSMGSILRLPVVHGLAFPEIQTTFRRCGLRTIAAVARGGADPDRVNWRAPVALVLGGEGAGLSDAVIDACDERVTIPMAGPVESLNVAVAAAILLYAARRQRLPR
jgi:RNA methyltransferase, TrmH family